MEAIKIILADDHPIVREGLRALLSSEKGFRVIAETGSGIEVEHLAASLNPDVIVLDIMMPDLNGLEITRLIRKRSPRTAVVILSMYGDDAYVSDALRAGALGYILKESPPGELIRAIKEAKEGKLYLCSALPEKLAEAHYSQNNQKETLTARERQVLYLIVQGNANAQIARRLCISTRTVEGHRSNIMHKLGINNKADLIRYALQLADLPQAH